jgi:hypothetical protein
MIFEKTPRESRHSELGKQIGPTPNPDMSGNAAVTRKAGNPEEIPDLKGR